jgi:type VI secretion system Hcp family effector
MIRRPLFLAIAVAFLSVATASAAIFVKIPSIPGESKDKEHKGWIDVLSVSGLPRDAASGLPTGKRQHKPISITKPVDKATPILARSSRGKSFPSAITLSKDGVRYQLTGVKVNSVKRQGNKEVLTLTYGAIKKLGGIRAVKAQDYNSSRSNNSSRAAVKPGGANHNTTRSNR